MFMSLIEVFLVATLLLAVLWITALDVIADRRLVVISLSLKGYGRDHGSRLNPSPLGSLPESKALDALPLRSPTDVDGSDGTALSFCKSEVRDIVSEVADAPRLRVQGD